VTLAVVLVAFSFVAFTRAMIIAAGIRSALATLFSLMGLAILLLSLVVVILEFLICAGGVDRCIRHDAS
jgi:hypothetical protein